MGGPNDPNKPGKVQQGVKLGKDALSRLKNIEKILEEERSTYTVTGLDALTGYSTMIEARMKTIESSIKTISAAGLTFAKGGKIDIALTNVATLMDKMAGNAELGSAAIAALSKNMELFPMLAEKQTAYAESLGLQAASLDRLGISFQQYTQNVDIAQNMFNMTQEQILGLNQGLKDFADEMKMLPSTVSSNFQLVAKSLSYEGPKVAEQFKNMQKLSQQTGVSVGTLMSGFGDRLDTVGGAAQFVGQLNAILGFNAFSPNEILMMDEDERMLRVREVIRAHPIYDDIMSGGKIGKFALNTLSKVIGYSKADTRKYLTGNLEKGAGTQKPGEAGSAKSKAAQGVGEAFADGGAAALDKFAAGLNKGDLMKAIERNTNMMKNLYLSPGDRAMAEERAKLIGGGLRGQGGGDIFSAFAKMKPGDRGYERTKALMETMVTGQSIQDTTRFGIGGLEELADSIESAGGFKGTGFKDSSDRLRGVRIAMTRMPQINRIFELLQTLPQTPQTVDLRKKLGALVSSLSGQGTGAMPSPKALDDIELAANELLSETADIAKPFREGDDDITYLETQAIAAAKAVTGKGALGFYRKLIRFARESDSDSDFQERVNRELNRKQGDKSVYDQGQRSAFSDALKVEGFVGEGTDEDSSPARDDAGETETRLKPAPFTAPKPGKKGKKVDEQSTQLSPATDAAIASFAKHITQSGGLNLTLKFDDGTTKKIVDVALARV